MTTYKKVLDRVNAIVTVYTDGSFPEGMIWQRFLQMDTALSGTLDLSLLTLEEIRELKKVLWDGYERYEERCKFLQREEQWEEVH